ncbi:MAG: CHAT domain-containing protein [Xenococcaceae cyanobacterium]
MIIVLPLTIPKKSQSQVKDLLNTSFESAQAAYQSGNYSEAITIWQNLLEQNLPTKQLAAIHSNIASVYWHLGESGKAVDAWGMAVNIYRKHVRNNGEQAQLLAATLIDLATAYNDLGQPIFSRPLLSEVITLADEQQLNQIKPFAYFALGNAHTIEGNYSDAISAYSTSLEYNESSPQTQIYISTHSNLSQAYERQALISQQQAISAFELGLDTAEQLQEQAQQYRDYALSSAQTAVALAENISPKLFKAEALLQLAQLSSEPTQNLKQAQTILLSLPISPAQVYALLDLAQQLQYNNDSLPILTEAIKSAQKLNNPKLASFAHGAVGHYYELQHQYPEAIFWTRNALTAAESAQASDSSYRWHWQLGRILTQTGQIESAISSYRSSITSLQAFRSDLIQAKSELTFNFQENIEPIYRQLLQLLLSQKVSSSSFDDVWQIRDLLQLSELESFFQDDCLSLNPNLDTLETLRRTNSVIVNSIILEQHTYLIWQFPNGQKTLHALDISRTKLETLVKEWRFNLENLENENYLPLSQQFYRLFFNQELESSLARLNPSTLVFINDGILRNVPMSALHDGQQFLIEKYAISNSLGLNLQLTETNSTDKKVLAFGLSSKTQNFPPLPYVKEELNQIKLLNPNNQQFFNEKFTADNFSKQTRYTNSSVIHLATHGWFSGSLESSFLQAYQSKISLPELEATLIQHNLNFPHNLLELLILSACDTAMSDRRATLGMSGVALRAGVNNVLGSLWSIQDLPTVLLISEFYRHWLNLNSSKAESLRQAQLKFINSPNNHPALWSSMILITN